MKSLSLLGLSLALNCALLAAAGLKSCQTAREPKGLPRTVRTRPALVSAVASQLPATPSRPAAKTPWQGLEATDYRQFIANLRRAGCPEQTIRDILLLRMSRAFHRRLLDFAEEQSRTSSYWQGHNYLRQMNERARLVEQLRRERDQLTQELLGEPFGKLRAAMGLGGPDPDEARSFLSPEKRRKLRELEQRYHDLADQVRNRLDSTHPEMVDEDQIPQLRALDQQKQAELAQWLTPRELEALALRESPAAKYVLQYLPEARTAAEFRIMVAVAGEFGQGGRPDYEYVPYPDEDAGPNAVGAEPPTIEARIKELLGEDFLEQRRQEETARRVRDDLSAVTTAAGINAADASRFTDGVLALLREWGPKIDDPALSAEQKAELENTLKAELERIAVEIMGAKGRDVVKKLDERP